MKKVKITLAPFTIQYDFPQRRNQNQDYHLELT